MTSFVVGVIVGASVVGLLVIVVAPSRRIRAEKPLARDVETKLLLGQDPDEATIPPTPRADHPRQYSSQELAQLRRLGSSQTRRGRR